MHAIPLKETPPSLPPAVEPQPVLSNDAALNDWHDLADNAEKSFLEEMD